MSFNCNDRFSPGHGHPGLLSYVLALSFSSLAIRLAMYACESMTRLKCINFFLPFFGEDNDTEGWGGVGFGGGGKDNNSECVYREHIPPPPPPSPIPRKTLKTRCSEMSCCVSWAGILLTIGCSIFHKTLLHPTGHLIFSLGGLGGGVYPRAPSTTPPPPPLSMTCR